MPTYEYVCDGCGGRFDRRQGISEPPVTACPECGGKVNRVISGGAGFLLKDGAGGRTSREGGDCALHSTGRTCCGREERCGDKSCGS